MVRTVYSYQENTRRQVVKAIRSRQRELVRDLVRKLTRRVREDQADESVQEADKETMLAAVQISGHLEIQGSLESCWWRT